MRTPTLVLFGTTVGLALGCGYLALQVQQERQRASEFAVRLSEAQAHIQRLQAITPEPLQDSIPSAPETSLLPPEEAPPPVPPTATTRADTPQQNDGALARGDNRRWWRVYADPRNRALFLEQTRVGIRQRYPGIGRALGMTREEEEALIDLLAAQQMADRDVRVQVRGERDPAARQRLNAELQQREKQKRKELEQFLGPERLARYDAYGQSLPDRLQLVELRSRLDVSQALSEQQSDYLINAMREERQQYVEELRQQPWFGGLTGAENTYPVIVRLNTKSGTDTIRAAEEKLARSEAFIERLQQRAAGILTSEQLRAFDELMQEKLMRERLNLVWIRGRAERAAAGSK